MHTCIHEPSNRVSESSGHGSVPLLTSYRLTPTHINVTCMHATSCIIQNGSYQEYRQSPRPSLHVFILKLMGAVSHQD